MPDEMKTDDSHTTLYLAVVLVLFLAGLLAITTDGLVFLYYLRGQGIGLFRIIPVTVWWTYLRTFPGNMLTALVAITWGGLLLFMRLSIIMNRNSIRRLLREARGQQA